MGLNADYKDLKLWAKIATGGFAVLVPIMFLDLFLLRKDFFVSSPIYINIIIAYALIIPLFFITTFWSFLFIKSPPVPHEYSMYYGVFLTMIFLLGTTYFGTENKWTFRYFYKINIYFSLGVYFIEYGLKFLWQLIKELKKIQK